MNSTAARCRNRKDEENGKTARILRLFVIIVGFEKTANFVRIREVSAFFVVGVDVLGDPFRREILFSHRRAGGNVCVTNLPFSVA